MFIKEDIRNMKEILAALCSEAGVSGFETAAADRAAQLLSAYASVKKDNLGSVIGEVNGGGSKRHILLDAHIDQIGLIVTEIDKTGFLRFTSCGAVDTRLLSGTQVTVWGSEPLFGVICSTPPHLSDPDDSGKAKDIDKLGIDIGLSGERADELVSPGDRVTFNGEFCELLGNRVSVPALDDRAGVAVILRTLELLKDKKYDNKITVVFSVCEETGGSGASAAAFGVSPDEAIAIDVSFADSPGIKPTECRKLGSGAMIGISPVLSRNISNQLKQLAQSRGIPYTLEIMGERTGTNADRITIIREGVKTGLISVPLRNMHSAAEVVDIDDLESCARLIAEYISEEAPENA